MRPRNASAAPGTSGDDAPVTAEGTDTGTLSAAGREVRTPAHGTPVRRRRAARGSAQPAAGRRATAHPATRILVVEDNLGDADLIRALLEESTTSAYEVEHVTRLSQAIRKLCEDPYDAIMLDLRLPDGAGVDTVTTLRPVADDTPIVVLTGMEDEQLGMACIEAGAQDYLCKSEMTTYALRRAVGHAISRMRGEELRRKLEHSDRLAAVGQLAAGVAHEVNNPAAFVIVNLRLMHEQLHRIGRAFDELAGTAAATAVLDKWEGATAVREIGEMLEDSMEGMHRIRSIVKDLQEFSRSDRDAIEPVDVNELVESSCNLVNNEIRHRARLVKERAPGPKVSADRRKLGQVFVNLLINAVHAIEEGAADRNAIRVTTQHSAGRVTIAVEDSGSGIPPEQLGRVFQPFFTTKPRDRGTGLGLSICMDIVTKLGGRIGVTSEVGSGSRFEVVLPVEGATLAADDVAAAAQPAAEPRRARILLIDDEPMLRKALRRILGASHEVVEADGGSEGLARIEEDGAFDVVICDLMMPDVDGPALYEAVRERAPALLDRILFLSGGVFTERAKQFVEQVGPYIVPKPIAPEALLRMVAEITEAVQTDAPPPATGRDARAPAAKA
jgi:signal transduction histidine kinase